MRYRIGVDVGGTFTDLVLLEESSGRVATAKVPSTPRDPALAFVDGIRRLLAAEGVARDAVAAVFHGTTVATNALLQRALGRTGLLTTEGFRDVLEIRRHVRGPGRIYDLSFRPPDPLVPRPQRLEVRERLGADGAVVTPLDEDDALAQVRALVAQGVDSIAVAFLHAWKSGEHEARVRALIEKEAPGCWVSLSSEISPELREYERASTTVINAALQPVVASYVASLESRLRAERVAAPLRIMQSNGGLLPADRAAARPVHLVVSGPAAGVVGGREIGVQAGFDRVITMDMGGTSCDLGLVEGAPLLTPMKEVDGNPIRVPSFDLHVIGAGGGSIAWIDEGGALRVGPRSAGADPGPACYGRGGTEPTVTDANLVLGRLNPDYFLGGAMAVDVAAARAAIEARIAKPFGLSVEAAAAGILRVVNAVMAENAKVVSVRQGHDPRDFALVAFGGAGPTHAAALIEDLQVAAVLVPPTPGTLSAAGLLASDVRHDHVRTHLTALTGAADPAIEAAFAALEAQARSELAEQGIEPAQIALERWAEMRYRGQGYEVAVPAGTAGELGPPAGVAALVERFHQVHERLYAHRLDAATVELVALRLTALGRLPRPSVPAAPPGALAPAADALKGRRSVYFAEAGGWVDCPIYARDALRAGNRLAGPAVIEQIDTTTVLFPGQVADVHATGTLVVARAERTGAPAMETPGRPDPFTVEIVRNALDCICEQMATTIERTAYSTLIRDILDFSTALFDGQGRIIAQGSRIPAHLNTMGPALETVLARHLPVAEWREGDVVVLNDPYHGGQHLPDVFTLLPIFHDGALVAFAGAMGHQVDVGGRAPGSFAGDATEIYQEGLRLPPVKLYEAGRPNRAVFDIIRTNIREPDKTLGDLASQVAALHIGERGLRRLIARYGMPVIVGAVEELIAYSEARMRKRIAEIPDGTYAWQDVLDDDGIGDRPVQVRATVTVSGSNLTVDFTGTDPQVRGPINCMVGMTRGTAYYVAVAVLDSDIPKNHGAYTPVRVIAPEGSLVNPRPPAPVVGRMEVCHRLVDVLLGCLAQAVPDKVMAPFYGSTNHVVISGEDAATGRAWVAFEIQPGGWGGRPALDGNDGWSAHMHNVQNVPVEIEETTYPLRVERYELLADSGGAGRTRGGLGLRRELRVLTDGARLTMHCDRVRFPAPGMLGGGPGGRARCAINPDSASPREVGSKETGVLLQRGDVVRFDSQGGGGYGPPAERAPAAIARDVADGKLSRDAARRLFPHAGPSQGVTES